MVKPARLILDESFRYVPAVATSVAETWRRFGWRPTTDEERKTRRGPAAERLVDEVAAVRPLRRRIASPLVENPVRARTDARPGARDGLMRLPPCRAAAYPADG
jgi:hypothetical protein